MSCTGISGQAFISLESAPKKLKAGIEEVSQLQKQRQHDKALKQIDRILRIEPLLIDAHMIRAEILYETSHTRDAAIALETAVRLDSFYSTRNLYSLARLYEELRQYAQAETLLLKYLSLSSLTEPERTQSERRHAALGIKRSLVEHPVDFNPVPLGVAINSNDDEALPAFTVDGLQMVFTRRASGQEDLFVSKWSETDSSWTTATPLTALNTLDNEGAHTISADGRVVAFTSCGRRNAAGSCDIYMALQRSDGSWMRARNLEEINTRGWEGQPTLTADGRAMYFSSERPGGHGKRDIWYSECKTNGRWSPAVNAGPVINTAGNESSPFLHFDDRTLYFMSDGHPGMGDYDLFVTELKADLWTVPRNMGYPINTEGREGALSVHPNGIDAYYTTSSPSHDGSRSQTDIFTFRLDTSLQAKPVSYLNGFVKDAMTGQPLSAQVEIYQLEHPDKLFVYQSNDQGTFMAALTHGVTYGVLIRSEGYLFYSDQFAMSSDLPYGSEQLEALLLPVSGNEIPNSSVPIVLRNVQFESNSASLLNSSLLELNHLLQLLRSNPHLHIEIGGHTDSVGEAFTNQLLSERRAKAVYDWLLAQSIELKRLSYAGYGESRPIAPGGTEKGRALNRRTEFVIQSQ